MPQTTAEIFTAALALPETERAEPAELLAHSVQVANRILHPAWSAELARRTAEIESGQVKPVPWGEVCQRVDEELGHDERISG